MFEPAALTALVARIERNGAISERLMGDAAFRAAAMDGVMREGVDAGAQWAGHSSAGDGRGCLTDAGPFWPASTLDGDHDQILRHLERSTPVD